MGSPKKDVVSFSRLRLGIDCPMATALRYLKDPAGHSLKPFYSEMARKKFYWGMYFEEVLTGRVKEDETDIQQKQYRHWINYNAKDWKLERIEHHARYCQRFLDLKSPHEKGMMLDFEFENFILRGEIDFKGRTLMEDESWMECIVDAKLTDSLLIAWDIGGNQKPDMLLQGPIYSLLWALNHCKKPELFLDAISLWNKSEATKDSDLKLEAHAKVAEWGNGAEILPSAFLVCESTDTPMLNDAEGNKYPAPPKVIRPKPITCTANSLFRLYRHIQFQHYTWKWYGVYAGEYDSQIASMLPRAQVCEGKSSVNKGKCPMLFHCPYGRVAVGNLLGGFTLDELMTKIEL